MRLCILVASCVLAGVVPAAAGSCPGNPDALGTSRTMVVDPAASPRIGTIQYKNTLALDDHEVVLTFDDGPLPPFTNRVLDTLDRECVKATFFLVGRMASAAPDLVRRINSAGHTIGTHSQNHPLTFDQMETGRIDREVSAGIASVQAAAGDARAVVPYFRIPGLARSTIVEQYMASKSLAVWSADAVADDWYKGATADDVVNKSLARLAARGHRGVLLLHDIQPATALALPTLLRELKKRGYKIVHAVAPGERPRIAPPAETPVASAGGWPRVASSPPQQTPDTRVSTRIETRPSKSARAEPTSRKKVVRYDREPTFTSAITRTKRKPNTIVYRTTTSTYTTWR